MSSPGEYLLDKYSKLDHHLKQAFDQAASGKGKERHANDDNWEEQKILMIPKLLKEHPAGSAAPAYQVIKKIAEAGRLFHTKGKAAALREVYGAIVYACATAEVIDQCDEHQCACGSRKGLIYAPVDDLPGGVDITS